jgi:hypothetical protein
MVSGDAIDLSWSIGERATAHVMAEFEAIPDLEFEAIPDPGMLVGKKKRYAYNAFHTCKTANYLHFDAAPPHALHLDEGCLHKNEGDLLRLRQLPDDLSGTYLDWLPPEVLELITFPQELRGAYGTRFVRKSVTETEVVYVERFNSLECLQSIVSGDAIDWSWSIKRKRKQVDSKSSVPSTLDWSRLYPVPVAPPKASWAGSLRACPAAHWRAMVEAIAGLWGQERSRGRALKVLANGEPPCSFEDCQTKVSGGAPPDEVAVHGEEGDQKVLACRTVAH